MLWVHCGNGCRNEGACAFVKADYSEIDLAEAESEAIERWNQKTDKWIKEQIASKKPPKESDLLDCPRCHVAPFVDLVMLAKKHKDDEEYGNTELRDYGLMAKCERCGLASEPSRVNCYTLNYNKIPAWRHMIKQWNSIVDLLTEPTSAENNPQ